MTGPPTPRRTPRRRPFLAALATSGLAALTGCASESGATPETDPSSGSPVEVLHNWTSGPNMLASESFAAAFREAHPSVPTDVRPVADADVDDLLVRRVEGGDPPGTVGTVPGENLAPFDDSLATVDDVWTGELTDAHPPLAREVCRRDGAYRAVPVAAFRVDTVYYNVDILDDVGVAPASLSSVDGLLAAAEAVSASSSTDARPLGHALGRPRPTLQLFAALLATVDPEAYRGFVSGGEPRSAVREAVAAMSRLLSAVGDDAADVQIEAGRRVGSGAAAVVQSGSWLSASLRRAGFGHRSEAGTGSWGVVGLGDAPVVLYDAFVPPAGSPSPEGAAAWLAFAGSETGQVAFNSLPSAAARPDPSPEERETPPVPRGSIPPRTDFSPDWFEPPLTTVTRSYRDADERLPSMAHGLAFPPATLGALLETVDERLVSAETVDVGAATDALVAAVTDA